jgi:hypothetical protein
MNLLLNAIHAITPPGRIEVLTRLAGSRVEVVFTDSGAGLQAKWTYTAESRNLLGTLVLFPVIKILWNRYMKAAMKVTKERAEAEVPRSSR